LSFCKYKNLIGSVNVSASGTDNLNNAKINVSLDITFYELYKEEGIE
jgi:hypothetical protein